ncbi:type I phosphomannose isomerase catalytic subunit [Bacteroidota bacterium]
MNDLYPLKFKPIFKDKIWGGQKVKTVLGMDFAPLANCGEVWVLSGVEGFESVVSNGFLAGNSLNELVEVYMYDLVGEENYKRFKDEFPVLIKFIDANDWLSIQVHPDDDLAQKRKIGRGKTEMWYVMAADPGAELISGFSSKQTQNSYLNHLESNKIKEIMNFEKVKKGDVFFMPAGRVHALGPGIFLAEIQETSDTTYRIYDWDRLDEKGNSRELHTKEALDALDFNVYEEYKTHYSKKNNASVNLETCKHFTTNFIHISSKSLSKDLENLDSFVAYICLQGSCELIYENGKENIIKGDTVVVPAMLENIVLNPLEETELLEVFISE